MGNIVYKIVDPAIGAPSPVTATGTTQLWPLGYKMKALDFQTGSAGSAANYGEFVYQRGSNATHGCLVYIDSVSAKAAGTAHTASIWPQMGIAAGALSATNVFGWVQVAGICDYAILTNTSMAAGAPVYLASTTGQIASTCSAVGYRVVGIAPIVSYTSANSSVTVMLNYPQHIGVTANL
jgi:hypothetical protein